MKALDPLQYTLPEPAQVERLFSADGTALHSEAHGPEGAPTVVLVHGWTCSVLFWAPVARRLLAQGLRVVLYDLRGHGRSAAPATRAGYSTGALADDLEAVVNAYVPPGSRVVLAGHSMGGMTILAASGRAAVRERTGAVLLASTGCGDLLDGLRIVPVRGPRLRRRLHHLLGTSPLPLGPVNPVTRKLLALALMGPGTTREQARFSAGIVSACRGRVRAGWGRLLGELDLKAEVSQVTAPTEVLVGTADKMTPLSRSDTITALLPALTGYTRLPGAGHMTPIERPDDVAGAVLRLADAHLAGPGAAQAPGRTQDKERHEQAT